MIVATQPETMTSSELERLADDLRCEIVNGELLERAMGWESEWIGVNLLGLLWSHCQQTQCGWVNGANAGYQCFRQAVPDDPHRVRKPDVSFIARERLRREEMPTGHCDIVPDLVAEVISPNDLYYEVNEKVDEYLRAGVRLVWMLDPCTRSIRVHRADGSLQDLHVSDELTGELVVTGFRSTVRAIFDVPVTPAKN